jgi:hypothetical protein
MTCLLFLYSLHSHNNLEEKSDPPRWMGMDGHPLRYLGEVVTPEGFSVLVDWFFVVEPHFSGGVIMSHWVRLRQDSACAVYLFCLLLGDLPYAMVL